MTYVHTWSNMQFLEQDSAIFNNMGPHGVHYAK